MTTQDYSDAYEDDSENVRGWPAQDAQEPPDYAAPLIQERNNTKAALARVTALVYEWRISEPRIGTHWNGCHKIHTDCLVLAIRETIEVES